MFAQPEKTLELYDLEVTEFAKGRGCYQCQTSEGPKLLVPFLGQSQRAQKLYDLLNYIKTCDIGMEVEQIVRTREGEILVEDEEKNRYILKDWIKGNEHAIFDAHEDWNKNECARVVRIMARLHKCLEEYAYEGEGFDYVHLYEKKCRQLIKVKNYARSKNSKNDFERLFLDYYSQFYEQAKRALNLVQEITFQRKTFGIIHGDMNQHNVLINGKNASIVRFESFKEGLYIFDLVNYLRKIMEKTRYDAQIACFLIQEYEKERPLSREEHKAIYVQFLFPEKYYKLTNHYDSSHKAWVSARDIEKLKELVSLEADRRIFLTNLFSFICE